MDTKIQPKVLDGEPNFQDMELRHEDKTGPSATPLGNTDNVRRVVSHPNEADVALQNLQDAEGLR